MSTNKQHTLSRSLRLAQNTQLKTHSSPRKDPDFPDLVVDDPFIVLTETKFSFRCIPVGIGTLLMTGI